MQDKSKVALLVRDLAFSVRVLQPILDLFPLEAFFDNNFYQCLLSLDSQRVVQMLGHMSKLKLLKYNHCLHVLEFLYADDLANLKPLFFDQTMAHLENFNLKVEPADLPGCNSKLQERVQEQI